MSVSNGNETVHRTINQSSASNPTKKKKKKKKEGLKIKK